MTKRIAVIGAGAWGIALAIQAARTQADVHLWSRKELPDPNDRLLSRLPGIPLPASITVSNDFPKQADLLFLAVPLQHMRSILPLFSINCPIIACCKGIEQTTLKLPLEIIKEFFPTNQTAVLSGPNFAHEVAIGLPTASVISSDLLDTAKTIASQFSTPNFRLYSNNDPISIQISGAAKNVFAIAAGAVIGAGLGENARASLITRGIAELSRLSLKLGGMPDTLSGLAGIGDMILTCTGNRSRNYSFGLELGKGRKAHDILQERTTATEGVSTTPALLQKAQQNHVDTPIIKTVNDLLMDKITIQQAKTFLMNRPLTIE